MVSEYVRVKLTWDVFHMLGTDSPTLHTVKNVVEYIFAKSLFNIPIIGTHDICFCFTEDQVLRYQTKSEKVLFVSQAFDDCGSYLNCGKERIVTLRKFLVEFRVSHEKIDF